jgi:hypothetical protein
MLPYPPGTALGQLRGYASNEARHIVEGRGSDLAESELLVGLAATMATYLGKKYGRAKKDEFTDFF